MVTRYGAAVIAFGAGLRADIPRFVLQSIELVRLTRAYFGFSETARADD